MYEIEVNVISTKGALFFESVEGQHQKPKQLEIRGRVDDKNTSSFENENFFNSVHHGIKIIDSGKNYYFFADPNGFYSLAIASKDDMKIPKVTAENVEKKIAAILKNADSKIIISLQELAQYLERKNIKLKSSEKHFEYCLENIWRIEEQMLEEFEKERINAAFSSQAFFDDIKDEFYTGNFQSPFFNQLRLAVTDKNTSKNELVGPFHSWRGAIQKRLETLQLPYSFKEETKHIDTQQQLCLLGTTYSDYPESCCEDGDLQGFDLPLDQFHPFFLSDPSERSAQREQNLIVIHSTQAINLDYIIALPHDFDLTNIQKDDFLKSKIDSILKLIMELQNAHKYCWDSITSGKLVPMKISTLNLVNLKEELIMLLRELAKKEKVNLSQFQQNREQHQNEASESNNWTKLHQKWPEIYSQMMALKGTQVNKFEEIECNETQIRTRSCLVENNFHLAFGRVKFQEKFGTGLLILPGVVLTCAHVILNETTKKMALPEEVKFKYVKNTELSADVFQIYYPSEFLSKDDDNEHDFAILILQENVGIERGYFGIHAMAREALQRFVKDNRIGLYGYREISNQEGRSQFLFAGQTEGTITLAVNGSNLISHCMESTNGYSGGGLFYFSGPSAYIVGVHVGSDKQKLTQKWALPMTIPIYKVIKEWVEKANSLAYFVKLIKLLAAAIQHVVS